MEEIIKNLNEFLESYIVGAAIMSIKFDNLDEKWTIEYVGDIPCDKFETTKEMVEFLHADQNQ